MKYILLLIVASIIYVALAPGGSSATPAAHANAESIEAARPPSAATSTAAPSSQHTDVFKAPIDRTLTVLNQVRSQKAGDQY
jgi:hypothetical protein